MSKVLVIYKEKELEQIALIGDNTKLNINKELQYSVLDSVDETLSFLKDEGIDYTSKYQLMFIPK